MKKTLLALFVVLLIPLWMTACSTTDTQEDTAAAPEEASQDVKDYSNGTPWPDIDLDGVVTEDMPTDVKDNYALYVNKDDILSLKIPADHVSAGTMEDVSMEEEEDTRRMFEGDAPNLPGVCQSVAHKRKPPDGQGPPGGCASDELYAYQLYLTAV